MRLIEKLPFFLLSQSAQATDRESASIARLFSMDDLAMLDVELIAKILIALCFFSLAGASWWLLRAHWGKARKPLSKREAKATDKPHLTRQDRKLKRRAKQLWKEGHILAAAELLESLHLGEEGVRLLEANGYAHEAAQMLMRLSQHEKAAMALARLGQWKQAASCFDAAGKPLEAARCFYELAEYEKAALFFQKAGEYQLAANCWEKAGKQRTAGKIYLKIKKVGRAIPCYLALYRDSPEKWEKTSFSLEELKAFAIWLQAGHAETPLAHSLAKKNKLYPVILSLALEDKIQEAILLLQQAGGGDPGPQLLAEVSYAGKQATNLAQIFEGLGKWHYAGVIYERLDEFSKAGEFFEKAQDIRRAIYCYQRAGLKDKARSLEDKKDATPLHLQETRQKGQFALASVTAANNQQRSPLPFSPIPQGTSSALEATRLHEQATMTTDLSPTEKHHGHDLEEVFARALSPQALPLVYREIFDACPLWQGLNAEQKDMLWQSGQLENLKGSDSILPFQDHPKGVYIILAGEMACIPAEEASNQGDKSAQVVPIGASFGEERLFTQTELRATFTSLSDSLVYKIARDRLSDLMQRDQQMALQLFKNYTIKFLQNEMNS